jgi:hypothetical protein
MPSSTKLNLHCVIEDTFGKEGGLLIPLVFSHFNRSSLVTFRSFKVVHQPSGSVFGNNASTAARVSTISPSRVFDNGPEDNLPSFLCRSSAHSEFRQLENIVERACSILPIAELEFLSVSAPDSFHALNWEELFRKCEKLTTIEASGHGTTYPSTDDYPSQSPSQTPPNNNKGKKKRRGKKDVPSQPARYCLPCVPLFSPS